MQQITLKKPELTLEQIDELKTTFGNITLDCTVDIGGTEYTMDTTELNLSGISSGDVAGVSEKLGMLSGLTSVELMKSDGTTGLTKEDVKTLKEALRRHPSTMSSTSTARPSPPPRPRKSTSRM